MIQAPKEQVEVYPPGPASGRVLIVDDEAPLVAAMQRLLGAQGHAVEIARDGAEGLAKVSAGGWDLIFLDVCLPGMSGIDILGRIKAHEPWLSVLVMTGYATVESAVEAVKLGALNYLTKPFDDIFRVCGEVSAHAIDQTRRRRPEEGQEPDVSLGCDGALYGAFADLQFTEAKQRAIETFETCYVAELMERTGGNISRAAREAGMDRSNFKRLLKKFQIQGGA